MFLIYLLVHLKPSKLIVLKLATFHNSSIVCTLNSFLAVRCQPCYRYRQTRDSGVKPGWHVLVAPHWDRVKLEGRFLPARPHHFGALKCDQALAATSSPGGSEFLSCVAGRAASSPNDKTPFPLNSQTISSGLQRIYFPNYETHFLPPRI